MSDQTDSGAAPMARVIEVDAAEDRASRRPLAPRIIPTERTEPVTPSEPAPVAVVAPDAPRRRDRVMTFGLAGVAALFVGNIPIRPPRADAWGSPFLNVPVFEPPAIDPSPVEGIAHINLDLALEFLLGDRLQ